MNKDEKEKIFVDGNTNNYYRLTSSQYEKFKSNDLSFENVKEMLNFKIFYIDRDQPYEFGVAFLENANHELSRDEIIKDVLVLNGGGRIRECFVNDEKIDLTSL